MMPINSKSINYLKTVCNAPIQHKKIFILVLLLILLYTSTKKQVKVYHFDYFIFSQRWLPTACIEYIEHGSRSGNQHHCLLPKDYKFWAIHGLWPTQENHMGPFFCNNSMPFDIKKLNSIESVLNLVWPNIEFGKTMDSLWAHEWSKHGTCAAQLGSLNSELKYFNATLNFFKTYNIQELLKKNHYAPGPNSNVRISELINLIKSTLSKLPQIHCIHEVKTNQPYLSEIRLCLNKNFELMDCGNIHSSYYIQSHSQNINGLTNCPFDRKVIFPDSINPQSSQLPLLKNFERKNSYDSFNEILKLIRFLQGFPFNGLII